MNCIEIVFRPVGVIHSEIAAQGMNPIRPDRARHLRGIAEIFPEHAGKLHGLEYFSHLYVIYHEARAGKHGTADRSPATGANPGKAFPTSLNGVGLSLVELILWQGNMLHLRGVEIQDGTLIIDIRPGEPRIRQTWAGHDSRLGQASETLFGLTGMHGLPA